MNPSCGKATGRRSFFEILDEQTCPLDQVPSTAELERVLAHFDVPGVSESDTKALRKTSLIDGKR